MYECMSVYVCCVQIQTLAMGCVELHINLNLLLNGDERHRMKNRIRENKRGESKSAALQNGKYGRTIKLVAVELHMSLICYVCVCVSVSVLVWHIFRKRTGFSPKQPHYIQ